ncbi:FAS1 domain-containing protein SELMODRAFT_448915 [Rhodamnia argentea]|uniref:FAS1 domain-containing protein SELMODRAFT_448915 n=1 Tax=Rhodamnia argentea TaxID=178133 RepID=A0A8B8PLV8_9MYRT|nr:FAS1 domain-containing protein SELMODRAFT_448915 [Rhodamnia argentea]
MATFRALFILLVALTKHSLAAARSNSLRNPHLLAAIEEMKQANYFSFVMLINMSPPMLLVGNLTFFMPDDRMLSRIVLPTDEVSGFVLRHSIPKPLLFDYLEHIPTGSLIPTSVPGNMVRINNEGRRSFFLDNVRITQPNVCVAGSSIRCHGIDGVLLPVTNVTESPSPPCPRNPANPTAMPTPPPPPPPVSDVMQPLSSASPKSALAASPFTPPEKSACSRRLGAEGLAKSVLTGIMVSAMMEFLRNSS